MDVSGPVEVCYCGESSVEIPLPEPLKGFVEGDAIWIHIDSRNNLCYPDDRAHPSSRKLVATPENVPPRDI